MIRARNAQVKKCNVRSKGVKGLPHGTGGLVSDLEHRSGKQGKKRKRPNENSAGKKKSLLSRYENLKFSELNTVPRMYVRYKVAFTKWPYVFSGALDLINQRLASQNAIKILKKFYLFGHTRIQLRFISHCHSNLSQKSQPLENSVIFGPKCTCTWL